VLTDPYEPGSTFKPFIAGPALKQRITHVSEVFPLHGLHYVTPYGRKITDVHGYDQLAFWDVLVKSSNIGMSMLAERMGNDKLYAAMRSFGFGKHDGHRAARREPRRVNPLAKWNKYSTESVSPKGTRSWSPPCSSAARSARMPMAGTWSRRG